MDEKNILVTGIGGNVGQGIIRNIRTAFPNVRIIGCNIVSFSAGNHLCDTSYLIPYAYDPEYIPAINKIVAAERIDLVIPSTDYEVYYLSEHAAAVNTVVAVSGVNSAKTYLDKYLSFLHHQQYNIPFAASFLPSAYNGTFKECIAKPRKGRGSRGLHINPSDYSIFPDEEYMIQEMHRGREITTAFYVNKQNRLHGSITLLRELDNGATSQCKVVTEYDRQLLPMLEAMIEHGTIKGSANLQSIVTEDGRIIPFEVNCRISGTNSIRSNFGFKDVAYTVQEYLYDMVPEIPVITQGIATRIMMDVIYPGAGSYEECINNRDNYLF